MITVALAHLASGSATIRVDPVNTLLGLAALIAVLSGLFAAYRRLARRLDLSAQLYRDFYGDDRPGVPRTPGVRIVLADLSRKLDTVLNEITPNHGSSIKDAVMRMDTRMETVETDVARVHERLDKGI